MKKFEYISALDGVRAVAAALVFLVHIPAKQFASAYPDFYNALAVGWIGVPLFFVLSGYLITGLGLSERKSTGSFSLARFYLRRMLRLWPIYFFIVFTGIILWNTGFKDNAFTLHPFWNFAALTFTMNIFMLIYGGPWGVGFWPFWTLAMEEQYYLFWGAALKFLKSERSLLITCLFLLIISVISRFLFDFPGGEFLFYRIQPHVAVGGLMIGCCLALLQGSKMTLPFYKFSFLALPAAIVLGLILIMQGVFFGHPFPHSLFGRGLLRNCVDIFCVLFLIAALTDRGWLNKILTFGPIKIFGRISYAFYCVHLGVLHLSPYGETLPFLNETSPLLSFCIRGVIFFLLSVLLSLLLTQMERPFRIMKQKLRMV